MRPTTVDHKVEVFISSSLGDKYKIVRNALRTLLLETNMTEVYAFEHQAASSRPPADNYLDKLEDSDIIVFLIDSAEDVHPGVLQEHLRARNLKKKSIYLFCNEYKKGPPPIQLELRNAAEVKYDTVDSFAELAEKAYRAVMSDITEIYHTYCMNRLVRRPPDEEKPGPPVHPVSSYTIDRRLISGFEKTKGELLRLISRSEVEVPASSPLDEHSSTLVRVLTGQASSVILNFHGLKNCLSAVHNKGTLKNIVLIRVDALKAYLSGKLQACLDLLHQAYKLAENESCIPTWLKNDLLVDSRYVEGVIDETRNRVSQTESQSLLDKSIESIYYPLVDRYDSYLYQGIVDKHHTELLSSPYSVNFMSYEPDIGNIASGFVTSLLHGSLVHLLGVRQRLTRTLTTFSAVYPYNHTMYVELLKLLLVQGQDRVIAKTLTAFSQITRTLDSDDIEYMLSGINTISIPHHRALSKCLLAKHFGSYMSDGAFDALFREILDALRQWLLDPNRILLLGSYLFDAIKANVYRAGSNEAISLSLTVLREGPKRWVDEALGVIRRTDPTEIPTDVRNEIADALIAVLADNSRRHDLTELEPALVFVHHLVADSPTELDSAVEKHMPDYYVGNYSLATLAADSVGRAIKHIQRLLKTVHARNKEQGKSGFYYGYSDEPLDTIRSSVLILL